METIMVDIIPWDQIFYVRADVLKLFWDGHLRIV